MGLTNLLLLNLRAGEDLPRTIGRILEEAGAFGFRVNEAALASESPGAGFRIVGGKEDRFQPDIILLCFGPPALGEVESACKGLREEFEDAPLVLVVESVEPRQLCHLLEYGAADFLLSPVRRDDLIPRLMRLTEHARQADLTVRSLKDKLGLKQFIGQSDVLMQEVAKIPKIAQCDATVLVTGETGTGKEMVARAIHYLSPRSKEPFMPVNCGAIPVELMENELFGHEAGAFTGANTSIPGVIHETHGGTLFLDEIDSLTPAAQVKVLRFLQEKEYRPLGSRKVCKADVRIVAASNVNFGEAVRSGKFRSDLYYRLSVIPICLPPLRSRQEDVPLLAHHLLAKYSVDTAVPARRFSPAALEKLMSYSWPGNVRELENVIQRAAILSTQNSITSEDICLPVSTPVRGEASFKSLKARAVAEFEVSYIRQLLATSGGNITEAASSAKKNRRAFWQLMRKHQISSIREASCRTYGTMR